MLLQYRIGTRLGIGFGAVLAAAVAAFAAATFIGLQGQAATHDSAEESAQRINLVSAMREAELVMVSSIRSAGLQTDGAAINADVAAYRAAGKAIQSSENEFSALPLSDAERATLANITQLRKDAAPLVEDAIKFTMAMAGDQAAKLLNEQFSAVEKRWAAELSKLADLQRERAAHAREAIARANRQRLLALGALLLLVVLGGGAFAAAMTRSVTRPLRKAVEVAQSVAEGDLDIHITAKGDDEAAELLRALQSMTGQLASMVASVRESALSIDVASQEISQGNMDLSNRTEAQAASVQSTSSTLQNLTSMVSETASNAHTAHKLTDETADVARGGSTAMSSVLQTMSRISESSRRISEIIGVIDGIAFQTNILALNAAVEAARAGEQGRGFAVVASEVRALAQRVTTAAAEVRTLIAESAERVDDGLRQADGMNSTMGKLLDSVDRVRVLVAEITSAASLQREGIVKVNESVRTIDTTTSQNAALVEEVAAAAQSLSGQTTRLRDLVQRFRTAG
ncbi:MULTISPECIES: methyl-accepting chemotaxis protein [unclassified Roseateles]|uniref:Methyl-accepting chemotaxis protein n=1 Tax=Roseateles paludis TaxID=3145238 RepID=A0ABV0G1W3_9BURK